MKLALGVLLLASLAAFGAGCSAPVAETPETAESPLVAATRLDRVTPAEVAKIYTPKVVAELDRCIAAHPEITRIDIQTISGFTHAGAVTYWEADEFLRGLLEETPELPVAGVKEKVEPWAIAQMSKYLDADGFYAPPLSDFLTFYSAHQAAREAKAFAAAKKPGGKDWSEIREMWREVQNANGGLDSSFELPVQMASDNPSWGDIGRALVMPFGMTQLAWGHAAVDDFGSAPEGPEDVPEWFPLAEFFKSSAIKKRWFFAGGDADWSTHWLVVLDEHDQLWAVSMGYSE